MDTNDIVTAERTQRRHHPSGVGRTATPLHPRSDPDERITTMMTTHAPLPPNHHADHRQFGGVVGYLAGLTMTVGRGSDARMIADLALDGTEHHVVDLGCGPGAAVREAARRVDRVTGVDPAGPMLRLARWLTRRPEAERIDWVEAGAEDLPFDDDSVSVCWSVASVHHWPEVEAGIAEVARVLEPGGRFVVAEKRSEPGARGHASHGWTPAQADAFAALLRQAGFVDVTVSDHQAGRRRVVVVQGRAGQP